MGQLASENVCAADLGYSTVHSMAVHTQVTIFHVGHKLQAALGTILQIVHSFQTGAPRTSSYCQILNFKFPQVVFC